jgi:hypothetical protein
MKFYKDQSKNHFYYYDIICFNNLDAIYYDNSYVIFLKNGVESNNKNSSVIYNNGMKTFCLNGITYGYENDFTKQSWRRFIKMQVFK